VARLPNDKQNDSVICQSEVQKTGKKKRQPHKIDVLGHLTAGRQSRLTSCVRQEFKPGFNGKVLEDFSLICMIDCISGYKLY
jgi:hypothetical protein